MVNSTQCITFVTDHFTQIISYVQWNIILAVFGHILITVTRKKMLNTNRKHKYDQRLIFIYQVSTNASVLQK